MTGTSLLKPEHFDKICRTCLSDIKTGFFISLFKTYLGDKIVKDVLQTCTSVQVEEADNLPQHVCNTCLVKLINSNAFFEQCQESDSLLKSIVNSQDGSSGVKNGGEGLVEVIVATIDSSDFSDEEGRENDDFVNTEENQTETPARKRPRNDFRCRQCDLVFNSVAERKVHENETSHQFRVKNKVCSFCGKAFATRDHLNRHVRTHTKEKPYQCDYCEMRFSMVQNLRRHEKLHTGERPFKCDDCGKGFIQRTSLKNHKKSTNNACATIMRASNENSTKLYCEHCGKCFKRHASYKLHLKRHQPNPAEPEQQQQEEEEKPTSGNDENSSDVREFICDICNKSYKTKSTLKTHQLTHGAKTFLCSECGKDFSTKSALLSHQKVHTKEKPYTCGICSKSFGYTGSFDTHMLLHTGVKKFVCKICSRSFTQGTHLKYHLRVHSGERPYACNFCGKRFAVKGNLTVHIRTHTGETPFKCPVCARGFFDSGALKKHRRSHGEVNGGGGGQRAVEMGQQQEVV